MENLKLTRIDNRLIHGQVGVTWTNHLGANLVLVANDAVSEDKVQQSLMDMVLPDTVQSRFFSIQKTVDIIKNASAKQKIFLVVKDLNDLLRLVEGGVPIENVNVGNLHFEEGKEQIAPTVSIDENDRKILKELKSKRVKLDIRRVPGEKGLDLYKEAKI